MESIEHPLLIVDAVNGLVARLFGLTYDHAHPLVPNYIVMSVLIVLGFTVLGLVLRSRLRVENPGTLQIILEDLVTAVVGLLEDWLGPKGRAFLPLIGTLGAFILAGNYLGLIPGFMAPTSNLNVTAGCAVTTWVYYHLQGIRAQGIGSYIKHFVMPPGVPVVIGVLIMFPIEIISHLSRVMSLSLRLFGNIFGEELVIMILGLIVPYVIPMPMMVLGLVTGGLQAFIFVLLSIIYLQGAVLTEHHDDHAHEAHAHDGHAVAAAA
jgi:F-type H+-transporting ATPase subunit a